VESILQATKDGVLLWLHVVPRAAKDEIVGLYGNALKVRLSAPPSRGAANAALIDLLAERLDLPKHQLQIVSGQTSRRKRIAVRGVSLEVLESRLAGLVPLPQADA